MGNGLRMGTIHFQNRKDSYHNIGDWGMNMNFVSYLINGISLGSVYAIIALGYTMVYGIAKMLNFAHGDVIMIGAYVTITAITGAGLPPLVAVLLAMIFCTVLGVAIERIAYRPLRNAASPLAVLITAIGVSYLLQNVALLIFGANTRSFESVVPIPAVTLAGGELTISGETIATIGACIVIMIGLTLFIKKTKAGQAMLAAVSYTHLDVYKRQVQNRRFGCMGNATSEPPVFEMVPISYSCIHVASYRNSKSTRRLSKILLPAPQEMCIRDRLCVIFSKIHGFNIGTEFVAFFRK